MSYLTIDNTIDADLKRAVTWQYDNASNLVAVIGMFKDFFSQSTTSLWDAISLGIDITAAGSASDFMLAYWGRLLGMKRPVLTIGGSQVTLMSEAYRRLLVARFRLLNSAGTTSDYIAFLDYIFDGAVSLSYSDNMAMTFTYTGNVPADTDTVDYHLYAVLNQYPDSVFVYPAGVKSCMQSQSPIVAFEEQVVMVKDGSIAIKSVSKVKVGLTITNTTQDVVNSVTVTADVTNSYSGTRTISANYKIKVDDVLYSLPESVTLPARISASEPSVTSVQFTATGDSNPTIGTTSKIYQANGTTVYQSAYLNATVTSFSKDITYAETVTVPVGSYIDIDSVRYTCGEETVLEGQESATVVFSATAEVVPEDFGATTVYNPEDAAIDNIAAVYDYATQEWIYPEGCMPTVLTGVRVYATLSGDTATVPAGAKTTIGGVRFFTRAESSLTAEDNSFVMVALGNHPVSSGSVTSVTNSEGSAIAGITAFTNTSPSSTDFEVETMGNGTFSWRRKNP